MSHCSSVALLLFLALFSAVFAAPASEAYGRDLSKRNFSGRATFFYVGLGNCGDTNVDSDWIVALATSTYSNGAHCNQQIKITDSKGTSHIATVKDSCPSCGDGDLDLSPSLFQAFTSLDDGVFQMTWEFVDGNSNVDSGSTSTSTNGSGNNNQSTSQNGNTDTSANNTTTTDASANNNTSTNNGNTTGNTSVDSTASNKSAGNNNVGGSAQLAAVDNTQDTNSSDSSQGSGDDEDCN
ncbi:hypothetical protein VNI00_011022 [Paramarasmius palmivorus]|uniref:RlpA-like protein double-psi beta-barrel domain-containing protein n=1 Tax=Paramarasmius palmivorus TaxID=297713 RepID=A0AAW0CEZ6_9AGAR